ncbi:MAG: DUF4203 domain-containing protein [Thermodesulfobacteriota bacterium]
MDTWFGIGAISVGLASCFYGYPLFRIFLILSGLLYGYLLGHSWVPASHPGLSLAIGLGAAFVLAALAYPLWSLGVIVVGGALGLMILVSLGLALNASQTVLILLGVVGAVAVGLLFYHLRDLFVMLTTAFNGAGLVVLGLGWYIPALAFGGRANLPGFVIMVVLGAFGLAVQYGMFRERRTYSS